jgi:hypothetical protein
MPLYQHAVCKVCHKDVKTTHDGEHCFCPWCKLHFVTPSFWNYLMRLDRVACKFSPSYSTRLEYLKETEESSGTTTEN